jgi:hypothetical protein
MNNKNILAAALAAALAMMTAYAGDIPTAITTPDRVETRIGTLEFKDGAPSKETVEKVYDNLDFVHGARRL